MKTTTFAVAFLGALCLCGISPPNTWFGGSPYYVRPKSAEASWGQ